MNPRLLWPPGGLGLRGSCPPCSVVTLLNSTSTHLFIPNIGSRSGLSAATTSVLWQGMRCFWVYFSTLITPTKAIKWLVNQQKPNYFNNCLIVEVEFQAKIPNFLWFQFLKYEGCLRFFVFCDSKQCVFEFWILRDISYWQFIDQMMNYLFMTIIVRITENENNC